MEAPLEPPAPPPPLRDPEFVALSLGSEGTFSTELEIEPEAYLRIVANPFLGLAGLDLWLIGVFWVGSLLKKNPNLIGPLAPILVVLFLASLWLIPPLFQYHCLDCGRTGRLSQWRRHACPTSVLRRLTGRRRRLRGPPPFIQIILWLWGTFSLLLLTDVFRRF